MHKILASYLQQFVEQNEYQGFNESVQFERFVDFCQIWKYYPDYFDVDDVCTSEDDDSIDGCAVLINDHLIRTSDDAEKIFSDIKPRQSAMVRYIFIQAKRSEGFDAGDLSKFGNGVYRVLVDESYQPNDRLLQEIQGIHSIVVTNLAKVENGRPDILLFYATTGVWNEGSGLRNHINVIVQQLIRTGLFNTVVFDPVDREGLIKLWNYTRTPVTATFTAQNIMPLPVINNVAESYLVIVQADELVEKVLSDEDSHIRWSVFQHNVRAFLGDDNPVNTQIRSAIKNEDNHDQFVLLNNGLTIVSPDVKVQATRVSVSDFQIVNGCQTSHVLFRNREELTSNIKIPIKVIETDDPDILARVVEATNSQSNVAQSQFLSIRPFVRRIEEYFDSFDTVEEADRRLYFERRTNQFSDQQTGKYRTFDIEKLARTYGAMFLDVPHLACRYPKHIIREMQERLYQDGQREIAYYTAALTHYRLALAFSNDYVPTEYRPYLWHILMIVKYQSTNQPIPGLSAKGLDRICEKTLSEMKQGGRAPTPPFMKAIELIKKVGLVSNDRLKRQAYTSELLKALKGL